MRRSADAPGHRLADGLVAVEADEADAVEHVLAALQTGDDGLGGEIAVLQRMRAANHAGVLEVLGRRNLNHHAGGTVGAAPDDGGVGGNVA
jgi:hypothetical protein